MKGYRVINKKSKKAIKYLHQYLVETPFYPVVYTPSYKQASKQTNKTKAI